MTFYSISLAHITRPEPDFPTRQVMTGCYDGRYLKVVIEYRCKIENAVIGHTKIY